MTIAVLIYNLQWKSGKLLGVSVNSIDSKTVQNVPSSALNYFYEPKPNSIDKPNDWGPNKAIYTINADSLNERFDYSTTKDIGVYRIITLGDSFTYGLYVDTKDNWTELLEDQLNKQNKCTNIKKFEVINLAVQGYDVSYNVERYRTRGVKYNPDLIIWFLYDQKRITEKIKAVTEKNREKWLKEGLNENSYEFWNRAHWEVMKEFTPDTMNAYQLATLNKINDYYMGKLVFLYQRNTDIDWTAKQFLFVDDFTRTRKYSYIHQIVNVMNTTNYHFPTDHHPNKEGHKAITEDVFQYLTQEGIIPCEQ